MVVKVVVFLVVVCHCWWCGGDGGARTEAYLQVACACWLHPKRGEMRSGAWSGHCALVQGKGMRREPAGRGQVGGVCGKKHLGHIDAT